MSFKLSTEFSGLSHYNYNKSIREEAYLSRKPYTKMASITFPTIKIHLQLRPFVQIVDSYLRIYWWEL